MKVEDSGAEEKGPEGEKSKIYTVYTQDKQMQCLEWDRRVEMLNGAHSWRGPNFIFYLSGHWMPLRSFTLLLYSNTGTATRVKSFKLIAFLSPTKQWNTLWNKMEKRWALLISYMMLLHHKFLTIIIVIVHESTIIIAKIKLKCSALPLFNLIRRENVIANHCVYTV